MKRIFLLIMSVCIAALSLAQEFDCQIQVSHPQLQGANYDKIFQSLRSDLYEFVNQTKWTNNVFSKSERIECAITITVEKEVASDEYSGKIQVTSSRPVYGTSYNSPLFNHLDDKFQFKYVEMEPIEFNQNTFTSNLSAVIAYYCYIMLGLDYDSFGSQAGTTYYQLAEKIVQNAQSAQEPGWKQYESTKNRYWLTENLLNDQYSGFRDFMYTYHRQGMDRLADKPTDARASIEESLESLRSMHRRRPGSFLMSITSTVKSDEIVNVFSDGFSDEKARVANIMKEIDAANSSKYDKITRSEQ
ncbi:MAG: DUF4835 family protein [Bacteroidales bacterium]|nr:DUF4835 family protein [Bacteroidales bacterium]